jgi:hypothetical protein
VNRVLLNPLPYPEPASFPTLDAAIAWPESKKLAWISRGWTEL